MFESRRFRSSASHAAGLSNECGFGLRQQPVGKIASTSLSCADRLLSDVACKYLINGKAMIHKRCLPAVLFFGSLYDTPLTALRNLVSDIISAQWRPALRIASR